MFLQFICMVYAYSLGANICAIIATGVWTLSLKRNRYDRSVIGYIDIE